MRSGHNSSDSAEDFPKHVANNHFYLEHGLQVSCTAGMCFLYEDEIVRDRLEVNKTDLTLAFRRQNAIFGCDHVNTKAKPHHHVYWLSAHFIKNRFHTISDAMWQTLIDQSSPPRYGCGYAAYRD